LTFKLTPDKTKEKGELFNLSLSRSRWATTHTYFFGRMYSTIATIAKRGSKTWKIVMTPAFTDVNAAVLIMVRAAGTIAATIINATAR